VSEWNFIVYKYHIFLIHLSVMGHFGYFHSLPIMNNAAINMGCAGDFTVNCIHSFRYIHRCEISGSYGSYAFSFVSFLYCIRKKNFFVFFILFFTVVVLIYIPTNSVWGFLYPHILVNIFVVYILDGRCSNRSEMES
jgi:hypothetical protein